jgi:hypothetical protein
LVTSLGYIRQHLADFGGRQAFSDQVIWTGLRILSPYPLPEAMMMRIAQMGRAACVYDARGPKGAEWGATVRVRRRSV